MCRHQSLNTPAEALRREGGGLLPADAEELVVVLLRPGRIDHLVGDRDRLLEHLLDHAAVALVHVDAVGEKSDAEGDMAVLVAGDVREPLDETRQGPHALVVVDDEVLSGEGEHPLDHHVVERHGLDQGVPVAGL